MLGSLFNRSNIAEGEGTGNNIPNPVSTIAHTSVSTVTHAKDKFIPTTHKTITNSGTTIFESFKDFATKDHHLKPTTLITKNATGAFLGSGVDDLPHQQQQKQLFHYSHHMSCPPILDHMSDELKFKLLGSKSIPYANTIDNNQTTTIKEKNYAFRVLIAEETGQIACRNNYKVSLDYSFPRGSDIEKIRPNELKQYTFGSMVRTNDSLQSNDKFRSIPNSEFILITRIFHFKKIPNRFAISLCIPKILLSIVTECWSDIKQWLDLTQRLIISQLDKMVIDNMILNMDNGLLPHDYILHFPKNVDNIVNDLQKRLIPCFRSLSEIPRLFIYPEVYPDFVDTWFKDVFNWLEIKDGPKLNFLPTLLATVLLDVKDFLVENNTTRLVLLSGNMVVANKLLFILANILEPRSRNNLNVFNKLELEKSIKISNTNGIDNKMPIQEEEIEDTVTLGKSLTSNKPVVGDTNSIHKIVSSEIPDMVTITSGSSPSSQRFHTSRKGWEIPRKNSASIRSTSMSSDDSIAEVIQASSFKSGSSSLRYLSSSLSSQPGSYGSWFNKRPSLPQFMSQSPSVKGSDSWERVPTMSNPYNLQSCASGTTHLNNNPMNNNVSGNNVNGLNSNLHRTPSGTSLHQLYGRSYNMSSGLSQTPQQSPSISEYDEYPWFGTTPESPRIDTYYSNNKSSSQYLPLKNINVTRDCQKITQSDIIDEAFDSICLSLESDHHKDYSICQVTKGTDSHAAVLELNYERPLRKDGYMETLPKYTSYITHFNYWFQVQAIPITPDSERHIISAMKKDLQKELYSNTLYVSLRSREIKKIIMKRDADSEPGSSMKQKTRKIFNNGKYGHVSSEFIDCIDFINMSVRKARALYEDRGLDIPSRNKQLVSIFLSIVNYNKQTI
ncbi:protein Lst4p [Monosporozyma unispora]|nr:Lst4p [Kazachstania unispora]